MSEMYARFSDNRQPVAWQPLADHLRCAAARASEVLQEVKLAQTGYVAGLCHDLGKYSDAFQQYLRAAAHGEKVKRGSVNHTFAGVRAVLQEAEALDAPLPRLLMDVIAYGVGAHHGLFDCLGMDGEDGLQKRLTTDIPYAQVMERASDLLQAEGLADRIPKAAAELQAKLKAIQGYAKDQEGQFSLGLLARLVASAVMEGDRTDSAAFEHQDPSPPVETDRRPGWSAALQAVEQLLASFPKDTPVQQVRSEISESCLQLADHPGGIFRLTVPAGGGKTLSVLRAALAHAKAWNKSRILFVMPLLAIIEQNAKEIRKAVGDTLEVLEHHSGTDPKPKQEEAQKQETREQQHKLEWLTQSWHHPLIVTTLFQLLMTLFSSETASVRRFQALCNSVIIVDEVQTVPQQMLSLWNAAVNFLAHCCGATVILCSATQPVLENIQPPIQQVQELVTLTGRQLQVLRRTTFHMMPGRAKSLPEVAEWIQQELTRIPSLLVVCNIKRQAVTLTQTLQAYANAQHIRLFHLSASMCPAHRTRRMEEMKSALQQVRQGTGPRVLCIATQVMDAGVDVSFHGMLRFLAGADTVVQTAGRVNRHGESETPVPVYMVDILDEKLNPSLSLIRDGKNATMQLLGELGEAAYQGVDLASNQMTRLYYSILYRELKEGMTRYVLEEGSLKNLFDILSINKYNHKQTFPNRLFRQAFWYGGDQFEVFDSPTYSLMVPYGEAGQKLYQEMLSDKAVWDSQYRKGLIKQAQPYAISVFQSVWDALGKTGAIIPLAHLGLYVLQGHYSEAFGFDMEDGEKPLLIL